jgi:hypothetical protein
MLFEGGPLQKALAKGGLIRLNEPADAGLALVHSAAGKFVQNQHNPAKAPAA